jgi:hypothetical protein
VLFSIQHSTTWIWRGAQLLNQSFEVRGPLGQGGRYLGVASRLGELKQRLRVTLEIVSADHDGRPTTTGPDTSCRNRTHFPNKMYKSNRQGALAVASGGEGVAWRSWSGNADPGKHCMVTSGAPEVGLTRAGRKPFEG